MRLNYTVRRRQSEKLSSMEGFSLYAYTPLSKLILLQALSQLHLSYLIIYVACKLNGRSIIDFYQDLIFINPHFHELSANMVLVFCIYNVAYI